MHALSAFLDETHVLGSRRIRRRLQLARQQLGETDHVAQRCLQVVRSDVGELLEFAVALFQALGVGLQLVFRRLALGHVAHGRGRPGALGGFQRRQADLDRELAAVLAAPCQFQPGAHSPHLRGLEVPGSVSLVAVAQTLGHLYLDRLADQGLAPVAEQGLGLPVHEPNPAFLVDDHHRVRCGLEQVADLFLAPATRGRIADRGDDEHALVRPQRRQADLHREFPTVLAAAEQLAAAAHFAHLRVGEIAVTVDLMLIAVAIGHQYLDPLAQQVLPFVSEQPLGLLVDEHDAAVGIDHYRGIG